MNTETPGASTTPRMPGASSWALIALILLAYLIQLLHARTITSPDIDALSKAGNIGYLTLTSEPWRLVTSMFMHGDWLHLLMNLAVLAYVGPLFIDDIDTRLFAPLVGVAALIVLAGGGYLVGRGVQRLADRFLLGSLQTEWRICQIAALAIALWALYAAGLGLSAHHINVYFSRDAGTPIRGEVVGTDSFIERPMNWSTCNAVPPARYDPPSPGPTAPRTVSTVTHTRYVAALDCARGGARVSVRWTHSQDRSLLGTQGHALRDAPLPDAIPAGLCGRLKVGALGLRYVDELQGCPHP